MNRRLFATLLITATVWAQNGSPQGTGPFPALMEQDAGLPTHTIYRPQDLSKLNGQKLPVLAWGNGACANAGDSFKNFLTEIASHGFLAIAIGPISNTIPKPPARSPAAERNGPNGPASMSSQLVDAIDWAIAENNRKDSRYFGKIDTSKIAVMGQSCGGIQTFAVAADPRLKLMGIWNSGILIPDPSRNGPAMEDIRKEQLAKVHSPIFFFTGDKSDVAYPNGLDDFQRLTSVPAFHAYKDGMGHGGTYREPNGGELGKIASNLLLWQLKGDKDAAKMFEGKDCGLCQDPKWHVSKKNMK